MELDRPVDVERFIGWLLSHGFVPSGPDVHTSSFGSTVRYARDDGFEIGVTCDRSQWIADLSPRGVERPSHAPDVVAAARDGVDLPVRWGTGEAPLRETLPAQLPEGMIWATAIPELVAWLERTPDAEERIREVLQSRTRRERGH